MYLITLKSNINSRKNFVLSLFLASSFSGVASSAPESKIISSNLKVVSAQSKPTATPCKTVPLKFTTSPRVTPTKISADFYLLGNSNVSEKQIVAFLIKNNPNLAKNYAEKIVKIYCIEAKRESINVAVAVAQMALETGFLQFNGAIRKEQNNFAGIGSVHATHRGESFATLEKGIRAHIQHLKVYAKSSPLKMPCVDPRRKFVQTSKFFGKLKTIYDLSGTWAADKNYGEKLAKLIQNLLNKSAIK